MRKVYLMPKWNMHTGTVSVFLIMKNRLKRYFAFDFHDIEDANCFAAVLCVMKLNRRPTRNERHYLPPGILTGHWNIMVNEMKRRLIYYSFEDKYVYVISSYQWLSTSHGSGASWNKYVFHRNIKERNSQFYSALFHSISVSISMRPRWSISRHFMMRESEFGVWCVTVNDESNQYHELAFSPMNLRIR